MAYIHHVTFKIEPEQMSQLEIGAALERALGYLRTLLPSQIGFITTRAMYSLDIEDRTELIIESVWENWDDASAHSHSSLTEDKILLEFEPHVPLEELTSHMYEEVP